MNIYETGCEGTDWTHLIRNKAYSSPLQIHSWTFHWRRFLDQLIRHHLLKRSLLHQISCYSVSTPVQQFTNSISYPHKTHRANDNSVQCYCCQCFHDSCTTHALYCVFIYSHVQRRKGSLLLSASSTATCSTQLDHNTETRHRLPSQPQRPPAH
jgi:hypothetical protein